MLLGSERTPPARVPTPATTGWTPITKERVLGHPEVELARVDLLFSDAQVYSYVVQRNAAAASSTAAPHGS